MTQQEIICIGCPLSCLVKLTLDSKGKVESVRSNQCKKGVEYARAEFQHPERVLTATVLTEGSQRPLLPVRTDKPVSRDKLKEIMQATAHIRVKPPVKSGQVIAYSILGTGINLIATSSLSDDI